MNEAAIAQTVVTLSLFVIMAGFFIWGWKSGQFKDIEEAKYVIFRRPEEPGEPPGATTDEKGGIK